MLSSVNHITLAVTNVERSFDFYRNILGFKPLVKWDSGAYFLVGDFWFCLNQDKKRTPSPCYTHIAFTVSSQHFDSACKKVMDSEVEIFKENSSPGNSLYFLDPDGHKLELHTGNWQTRIKAKKHKPGSWKNIQWFD